MIGTSCYHQTGLRGSSERKTNVAVPNQNPCQNGRDCGTGWKLIPPWNRLQAAVGCGESRYNGTIQGRQAAEQQNISKVTEANLTAIAATPRQPLCQQWQMMIDDRQDKPQTPMAQQRHTPGTCHALANHYMVPRQKLYNWSIFLLHDKSKAASNMNSTAVSCTYRF